MLNESLRLLCFLSLYLKIKLGAIWSRCSFPNTSTLHTFSISYKYYVLYAYLLITSSPNERWKTQLTLITNPITQYIKDMPSLQRIIHLMPIYQKAEVNDRWERNPEVQSRIHKGSTIIPILSQIHPIPHIDTYFFRVLPSMPRPP